MVVVGALVTIRVMVIAIKDKRVTAVEVVVEEVLARIIIRAVVVRLMKVTLEVVIQEILSADVEVEVPAQLVVTAEQASQQLEEMVALA